jgi:hypothetical protein
MFAPSDALRAMVGFPFAFVNYHPSECWWLEFRYTLVTNIHVRATYRPFERIGFFAGFDWRSESYELSDRPEYRDRFYYYEKSVSAGMQYRLSEKIAVELSSGYLFDRYYFQWEGGSILTGPDQVDVGNGPFLALRLNGRY